jgi:predicted protein tyrosine phosphatase
VTARRDEWLSGHSSLSPNTPREHVFLQTQNMVQELMADGELLRILFVCSRNRWRSPTAEEIWSNHPALSVRSAGVSRSARRRLSVADLRWADLILVMEEKHKSRIRAQYRDEVRYKTMHVLDIPDDYRFMDQELVDLLKRKVEPFIHERPHA